MSNYPRFSRLLFAICAVFVLSVFAFGDTVRLKDGSIIKGKIISFEGGKFTVLIDDGSRQRTFTYSADEVESIIFESEPLSPAVKNTSTNTTVITVGQTKDVPVLKDGKNDVPTLKTGSNNIPKPANTDSTPKTPTSTIITAKPITISISVLADNTTNGWTNSGWVVRKGQKIKIRGSGRVSLGNGRFSNPGGISSLPDNDKLMKDRPTGALIAVIGADNNDFIFVGDSIEFTAARDGDLFLGVNEGNLNDNSGNFDVTIEIDPSTGN